MAEDQQYRQEEGHIILESIWLDKILCSATLVSSKQSANIYK